MGTAALRTDSRMKLVIVLVSIFSIAYQNAIIGKLRSGYPTAYGYSGSGYSGYYPTYSGSGYPTFSGISGSGYPYSGYYPTYSGYSGSAYSGSGYYPTYSGSGYSGSGYYPTYSGSGYSG